MSPVAWLAVPAVVFAAACNPYDQMPEPRCGAAEHCLPGEECRRGYCIAPGRARARVVGDAGSVRALVIAAPASGPSPWRGRAARVVHGIDEPVAMESGAADLDLHDLPLLDSWLVAWAGDDDEPCAGTRYGATRLPVTEAPSRPLVVVMRSRWSSPCLDRPPDLHHVDRLLFDR